MAACKETGCDSVVTFAADDLRHLNFGALLATGQAQEMMMVYLRCGNDHRHRYEFNPVTGDLVDPGAVPDG